MFNSTDLTCLQSELSLYTTLGISEFRQLRYGDKTCRVLYDARHVFCTRYAGHTGAHVACFDVVEPRVLEIWF